MVGGVVTAAIKKWGRELKCFAQIIQGQKCYSKNWNWKIFSKGIIHCKAKRCSVDEEREIQFPNFPVTVQPHLSGHCRFTNDTESLFKMLIYLDQSSNLGGSPPTPNRVTEYPDHCQLPASFFACKIKRDAPHKLARHGPKNANRQQTSKLRLRGSQHDQVRRHHCRMQNYYLPMSKITIPFT